MQTSTEKSQKTSGGLGNLYVDDWQENRGTIGIGTLHLVSRYLQKLDQGPVGLKKQSQCNESSFCLLARPQDL